MSRQPTQVESTGSSSTISSSTISGAPDQDQPSEAGAVVLEENDLDQVADGGKARGGAIDTHVTFR